MEATKTLRIHVDPDRCQGHNRCKALAPSLFVLDALGQSREVGDGIVPPELAEKARLAVANCPEYAITLLMADAP
jgi:ferredoxin